MKYRVRATHPIDLATGRVVAPGEQVALTKGDAAEPHNARLIRDGRLVEIAARRNPKAEADATAETEEVTA